MPKILSFEITEADSRELETTLHDYTAQMQNAMEQMRQDQADIDRLKAETRAIAVGTRAILEQLENASC